MIQNSYAKFWLVVLSPFVLLLKLSPKFDTVTAFLTKKLESNELLTYFIRTLERPFLSYLGCVRDILINDYS